MIEEVHAAIRAYEGELISECEARQVVLRVLSIEPDDADKKAES